MKCRMCSSSSQGPLYHDHNNSDDEIGNCYDKNRYRMVPNLLRSMILPAAGTLFQNGRASRSLHRWSAHGKVSSHSAGKLCMKGTKDVGRKDRCLASAVCTILSRNAVPKSARFCYLYQQMEPGVRSLSAPAVTILGLGDGSGFQCMDTPRKPEATSLLVRQGDGACVAHSGRQAASRSSAFSTCTYVTYICTIYVYVYISVFLYLHIFIFIYIYIYIYISIFIYIHICICSCICTHMFIYTPTHDVVCNAM